MQTQIDTNGLFVIIGIDLVRQESDVPVLFNYEDVEAVPMGDGVTRRALITPERVKSDCLLLDRWTIDAGATANVEVAPTDLAWLQLLQGEATINGSAGHHALTTSHVIFLPPGFAGEISSAIGTDVLFARVPKADRFDPKFGETPLDFRCVDWRVEPHSVRSTMRVRESTS
ncbi:MAG: hypothetical protein OEW35_14370 [Gammaproteobacteria bacterium]|nr:hypothetical protein [Gammaproteobacteria bacterium]